MMVTSLLLFGKLAEVERWLNAKSISGSCLNMACLFLFNPTLVRTERFYREFSFLSFRLSLLYWEQVCRYGFICLCGVIPWEKHLPGVYF